MQNRTNNLTEFMRWDTIKNEYQFHDSRAENGTFSSSVFTLGKAFKDKPNGVESELFKEFLVGRADYAQQLSEGNTANSSGLQTNGLGKPYYDGYNPTQQDVLMGTFYETYTGRKIRNYSTKNIFPSFPLPNWTISWDGLGK